MNLGMSVALNAPQRLPKREHMSIQKVIENDPRNLDLRYF